MSAVERWSSIGLLAAAARRPNSATAAGGDRPVAQSTASASERLGRRGPHDRRGDRPEGEAHRPGRLVDRQARPGDGDDHGVAHADLGVALPAVEQRHGDGREQLAAAQCRLLDADHELADRQLAHSVAADQLDGGVQGREHRQAVAGRRAGDDVAADRRRVADLRRTDGARRLGQGRHEAGERWGGQLGVGDGGAEAQRAGGPVEGPRAQLGDAVDAHDELVVDRSAGVPR